MHRRHFATLAAALAPAAAAVPLDRIPTRRSGKVEIAFKSPGPQPNGLQATKDGLWIIDQGAESKAYLVDYDGRLLRGFPTETTRSSGITFDGEALWIGSTYSRETVRCDAQTGKALLRQFTPGAGVIYKKAGDPPGRSSPVPAHLRQPAPKADPLPEGPKWVGTGAHGQEWRDGKLWFAVPPSRHIYCIDPKTWTVEKMFPCAGNRVHGIGWEGKYLWAADSNLNAFYKHDTDTGAMVEKIQLADSDPVPHGMTIWQGWLWYCDDIGIVCRFRM